MTDIDVRTISGLSLVEITWRTPRGSRSTVMAEKVGEHLAVHPSFEQAGHGYYYQFGDAWKVSHIPSGMSACPYESLPTVDTAREWARIFAEIPGVDLNATTKDAVTAGVGNDTLYLAWREFAGRVWPEQRTQAAQPDRPEPVDHYDVRPGDRVEVEHDGPPSWRWEAVADNTADKDGLWLSFHPGGTLLVPYDATVRILQRPEPEVDEAAAEALARAVVGIPPALIGGGATEHERIRWARDLARKTGLVIPHE